MLGRRCSFLRSTDSSLVRFVFFFFCNSYSIVSMDFEFCRFRYIGLFLLGGTFEWNVALCPNILWIEYSDWCSRYSEHMKWKLNIETYKVNPPEAFELRKEINHF